MKKIVLISLLVSFAIFSQAQISLTYNGNALSNGDTVYLTTSDREVAFQPTIVNSGSTDRVCYMKGSWVVEPSDVVVSMCAGIHCNTGLKSSAFTVAANTEYGDGHVEFYFPTGSTTCLMKFSVYDTVSTAIRADIFLYIDAPVGIGEVAEGLNVNVYPNPATGIVNVDYTLQQPEGMVVLYSMAGAKVAEIPVKAGGNSVSIDVSQLPAGVYMCGIRDGRTLSAMKKLVVK